MYLLIILLLIQFCKSEYFIASKSNIFSLSENDQSYFGYSLQLQQNNELGRIIVGAPRANKMSNENIYQKGAVFSCSINTKTCDEILPEEDNKNLYVIGLGSALDAEESADGFVVTCAPRWRDTIHNNTIGMCFSFKNNTLDKNLYPLEKSPSIQHGLHYSRFGEVGFSAHLIKNREHSLILGSPGIYGWTGTLAQYSNLDKKENSTIATPSREDKKIDVYSYFGYSISAGKFNASDPSQIFYVSGAPRNKDLYGSVNIFDPFQNEPFKNQYMFSGTQFGEYFGASITVGNLDADDLDDIVIGAPTYSIDNKDDVGCIYVFHAVKNLKRLEFRKYVKITEEIKGSKFGFALSYLGDINNDGFGDIAVGAPYYENNGAVYIYFGSRGGLQSNSKKEIILASHIDKSLRGFGYSLSRGLDVDRNTNNDFAVGAYISGHVVLLISRPIVKIETNMEVDQDLQLNIDTTNLLIKYCINYETDKRLPSNNIELKFSIINPDTVTFEDKSNKWIHTVNMEGSKKLCGTFNILVNSNQLFSNIILQMDYEILTTSLEDKFKSYEEHHSPTKLEIPFNKGCSSNVCKPNLKLTSFTNIETNWIIGTPQNLQVFIILENMEEHSYKNKLEIQVTPEHLKFSNDPNYCDHINNTIKCNFKYPILKNEIKNITFELDTTNLDIDDTIITVNSTIITDMDTDTSDNNFLMEVPLKSDVNFKILPISYPEEIFNLTENQTLIHQYYIENVGVTSVEQIKLNLLIPYEVKGTKFLQSLNVTGCSNDNTLEEFITLNREDISADNSLFVNCTSPEVKCYKIECEISNSLNSFSINATMTIKSNLIGELHNEGPIIISTTLEPDNRFISTSSHIWTKLANKQQAASITKYLIIGISVSLLLVLILIFILYKCGFFTKKKLPDKVEHEQLLNGVLETNEIQSN